MAKYKPYIKNQQSLTQSDRIIIIDRKITQKFQTLAKLQFLKAESKYPNGIKPEILSDLTGIPKASMRRILSELTKEGITKKIPDTNQNRYKLK